MTSFKVATRAAATFSRDTDGSSSAVAAAPISTFTGGYSTPTKSFFNPTPTRTTTALNSNGHLEQQQQQQSSRAHRDTDPSSAQAAAVSEPSLLSKSQSARPRREFVDQMRRKASDSAIAAASTGGICLPFVNARAGKPVPAGRSANRTFSTSPRFGMSEGAPAPSSSTSLRSVVEALSLPPSVLNSGAKSRRPTGHTHFGEECYGSEPGVTILNQPAHLAGSSGRANGSLAVPASNRNRQRDTEAATLTERRSSVAESVGGDDETGATKGGKELPIHRCERCNKMYRHPSCLVKHRWEHTVYWKEASKFLMSKHQQVQLLEAAAILVNMDGDSASLPEEKALWPAAVSPASSGLLGSDKVNFDRLMQRKAAMRDRASSIATKINRDAFQDNEAASVTSSAPRSASDGLSPLNTFFKMDLNGTPSHPCGPASSSSSCHHAYSFGSLDAHRRNSDVQHLALDESDERTTPTTETEMSSDDHTESRDRSGSAETTEDDEDVSSEGDEGKGGDNKWGLHEDALAAMDMEV